MLYLVIMPLGIISSVLYLMQLRKSVVKLPQAWKKSASQKNFRNSVCLLTLFLSLALINQIVLSYLATHHLNNVLAFSILFTFVPIPLFTFLFIHTQSRWKRICYIILHAILIGYLISGGYYRPSSRPNITISLLLNSVFFLIALLHLTDLLIHPKTDHFKFKLKINLVILVFSLLASILSTLHWSDIISGRLTHSPFIFILQNGNMLLFYFSFTCVFVSETIKLRRE